MNKFTCLSTSVSLSVSLSIYLRNKALVSSYIIYPHMEEKVMKATTYYMLCQELWKEWVLQAPSEALMTNKIAHPAPPKAPFCPHCFLPHQYKKVTITARAYIMLQLLSQQAATIMKGTLTTNGTKKGKNQVAFSDIKKDCIFLRQKKKKMWSYMKTRR